MPRFHTMVKSAAAVAAGAPVANVVAGAAANFKLRSVAIGFVNAGGAVTSQQVSIGVARATARGTQTTTKVPQNDDPRAAASAITGVDTAWSVNPTFSSTNLLDEIALNTQSLGLQTYEFPAEIICDQGAANGIVFFVEDAALPSGYKVVVVPQTEE